MKKRIKIIIFLLLIVHIVPLLNNDALAEDIGHYEKYGLIAINIIQADYSANEIPNYKYLGRLHQPEGNIAIDSFEFNVKEDGLDMFVIVKVTHNLDNQKIVHIAVVEKG